MICKSHKKNNNDNEFSYRYRWQGLQDYLRTAGNSKRDYCQEERGRKESIKQVFTINLSRIKWIISEKGGKNNKNKLKNEKHVKRCNREEKYSVTNLRIANNKLITKENSLKKKYQILDSIRNEI